MNHRGFQDRTAWYLGLSAYWFAASLKWFILMLLLPVQVQGLVPGGEKNSWWGLVVIVGALEAMVGPAVFGSLSDRSRSRFGRRRPFLAVGAGLTALALLFLGQADRLWTLVLGYLFLQVSDDVATGPYSALIPDLVPEARRGRASGTLSQLQLLAQIAAAGLGLLLKSVVALYATIAAVNVLCALIVLRTVREEPVASTPAGDGEAERAPFTARVSRAGAAWLAPWRSRDFRWVWLTRFLNALGFYLILLYLVYYLTDRIGSFNLFGVARLESAFQASIVLAMLIALAGAVSAGLGGPLADRIGRKRVIHGAGWIMFAALVPFALIPRFEVIAALAVLFGIGYGAYLSATWALAADILPSREDAGKDMGIWQMSIATPQVLAGLVGVAVDAANRQQAGLGYTLAFLFASLAFLVGSTLVLRVKGST